jgi:hypothetical protein
MIKVKRIKLRNSPDLILSERQWNAEGGWLGLIKAHAFNLNDTVGVETSTMPEEEFDKLPEWEGG